VTQGAVCSVLHNLRPGQFTQNFRDLSIATRDEADLQLETLRDFLHDEAAKGPEVFEAFGMKFPAGQITLWGDVLLLSVQLYFLVYLRQLYGKLKSDDPGWDVPWLGMDSSRLSETILYISLVILPPVAATLLGWQSTVRLSGGYWEKTGHWVRFLAPIWKWDWTVQSKVLALIFAVILSAYLGVLSWTYRPQINPERSSRSPQLSE
jgi:hypothetical protein